MLNMQAMQMCVLYCVIVFVKFCVIASSRKCNGHCCTHFFAKGDLCTECANGTFRDESDDQDKCKPCPYGKYGYRCTQNCRCTISTHTCDPVTGECCCRYNIIECVEGSRCSSNESGFLEELISTEKESIELKVTEKESIVDPVTNYWLLVGVPCGVVVLATTVIFFIQIGILKSRRNGKIEIPLNDIVNFTNDVGNNYDDIDENIMLNRQQSSVGNIKQTSQILTSDNNSSGLTDACTGREHNGYINPYTPLTEDWHRETHVYDVGDDLNEDKEYLNPYQPLTEEWEKHTHVYD